MLSNYHAFRTLVDTRASDAPLFPRNSPPPPPPPPDKKDLRQLDERVCEVEDASGDENDGSAAQEHTVIITSKQGIPKEGNVEEEIVALLERAEKKLLVGKYFDASSDCRQAEELYLNKLKRGVDIIAKVQLLHGKCQFKLGNIKKAHTLLLASEASVASQETEALIKEVDKMMYFESLLDWSMSNPLFSNNESPLSLPQHELAGSEQSSSSSSHGAMALDNIGNGNNNTLNASLRSLPVLCPKLTSEHKYEPEKSAVTCWQHVFLRHTKKNGIVKVK